MSRAIGAARLSHRTDESTSITGQKGKITHTAAARGDKLIHITEDEDVSGSVSPFERESLGPWLTEPGKVAAWDVLIIAKLDRLTRSLRDFDDLRKWCDANRKILVSVDESLDLSTSTGRMFANLLAMFAQFERERISERRTDAARRLKSTGAMNGGKVPFGYRAERRGTSLYLIPDEDGTAPVLREMAAKVIAGASARSVAMWLTESGVPVTSSGHKREHAKWNGKAAQWDAATVLAILRSDTSRGIVTLTTTQKDTEGNYIPGSRKTEIVRDGDGGPLTFPGVLDDTTWTKLQRALTARSAERRGTEGASLLTSLLACPDCGASLPISRRDAGDRYRHAPRGKPGKCGTTSYLARDVDSAVSEALMGFAGDVPRCVMTTEGTDNSAAIAQTEESVADLERAVEDGDMPAASAGRILTRLETRLARLRSLPGPRKVAKPVASGETFGQYWESLGTAARNAWLRELGVEVSVWRGRPGSCDDPPDYGQHDTAFAGSRGGEAHSVVECGKFFVGVSFGDLAALTEAARAMVSA